MTGVTDENHNTTTYNYDNAEWLVSVLDAANNLTSYTYDGVGNRLTMTNAGEVTYSYDANNKLTQLVGPSGTTTFGYDANGNMTGMNLPDETVWAYGYDYENRLVSVADNSDYTAAYTYGPDGLRLRVQESNNPNPDRWFQYDGVRPALEGTLASDTFTAVNTYIWEGDTYYSPLIHADFNGSDRYFAYDGLGSTRQLLDSDETVTDSYSYEAFGNVLSNGGPTPNPYKYVGSLGYYACGDDHLLHLGARYYMPEVGRFMSQDPMLADDDPYALAYALADNNPVSQVDPSGLATCLIGSVSLKGCKFSYGMGTDKKKCPKNLDQYVAYGVSGFNLNTCVGTPKNCKPHNQKVVLGFAINRATCYYSCKFTGQICEDCPSTGGKQGKK